MALVPTTAATDAQLIAEVDMGSDSSVLTVRATVVQASTIFYDTAATLGSISSLPLSICFLRSSLAAVSVNQLLARNGHFRVWNAFQIVFVCVLRSLLVVFDCFWLVFFNLIS